MKKLNNKQLKELWFKFFERRGYVRIPSASIVPENDASVLFTTAGMHPLVPYLLGEKHTAGTHLINFQKCIRTNDIDEVGDDTHCTFFEMLGNWTLGECDKVKMIKESFQFLTDPEYLDIDKKKLAVSVFEGDDVAPRDDISYGAWIAAGLNSDQIFFLSKEHNWWGLGDGAGPCGPDTEMFYDTGKPKCSSECSPACKCGKYIEIWNDVFLEYFIKNPGDKAEKLLNPSIDTGMGVERTLCLLNNVDSIYDFGAHKKVIDFIGLNSKKSYKSTDKAKKSYRVITDHLRAAVFILADEHNIIPSSVGHGYVLRRLIRRSINHARKIEFDIINFAKIAQIYINEFKHDYPELKKHSERILTEIIKESEKFLKTISDGQKEFEKVILYNSDGVLNGKTAFRLYDTFGFPLELTVEMSKEKGLKVDVEGYHRAFAEHQEKSRAGAAGHFKGGLSDTTDNTIKLHTATHLLMATLRILFGNHIVQKGSNITPERLRLDFNFERKLTDEELRIIENKINSIINSETEIVCEEMHLLKAKECGAYGIFDSKYGENVKVYTIGEFSKEICGGPHVQNTKELGHFKILKEESSSSGIRRIKAVLE